MLDPHTALRLAEIRHREEIAAAERWRLARQVAPANRHALRIGGRWLARLGAWLEWLGCALQARYHERPAAPPEAACAR